MTFLSAGSQKALKSLIQLNPSDETYILTRLAMMILSKKFPVYKGEWELVVKKAKKQQSK